MTTAAASNRLPPTPWRSGPAPNGAKLPTKSKRRRTPVGSAVNTVTFPKQTASKCRVVFTHQGKSRSGVSEILVWKE